MKRSAGIVIVLISIVSGMRIAAAAGMANVCGLLARGEIQHALGGTATGFDHATEFRGGSTSMCQGQASGATVTVRVSAESEQDSANEQTIAQMITNSGGKVETETTEGVTCTTIIPTAAMSDYGYDSMCEVKEGSRTIAVQASTRDRKAIVPVAALRGLVRLAARRWRASGGWDGAIGEAAAFA
jgi:hypothetical protein